MNEVRYMAELPKAPIKRIMKNAGAERVSEDAVEQFRDRLEELAEERAETARSYTRNANRKTVQASDVKESF